MDDKITWADEAYGCTTTKQAVGPCGRSVVYVQCAENPNSTDVVTYGQPVRFVTNPYILHKPLYLHSTQCTPEIFARFSR